MLREEVEDLIQRLRPQGSEPFFGIYDGATADPYIRANREGLQLFARELLKASLTLDHAGDNDPIPLPRHAQPEGEVRLTHVRPYDGSLLSLPEPATPGVRSRLFRWSVLLGAIVVGVSTIVGFYTITRWFF